MPGPVLAQWQQRACGGSLGSSAHVSYLQPTTPTAFQGEISSVPQQLLPPPLQHALCLPQMQSAMPTVGLSILQKEDKEKPIASHHLLEQDQHKTTHPSVALSYKRMF